MGVKNGKVGGNDVASGVEVRKTVVAVGAWAPRTQQGGQIDRANIAIAIQVCGGGVIALRDAGRIDWIGPGLFEQLPVRAVHSTGPVHIGPCAAGPRTAGSEQAFLEKVQIVGINLPAGVYATSAGLSGSS